MKHIYTAENIDITDKVVDRMVLINWDFYVDGEFHKSDGVWVSYHLGPAGYHKAVASSLNLAKQTYELEVLKQIRVVA